MNSSKILITGVAGFIGYHLCKSLLEDGYKILGIDNLNDYYDTNLKKARLEQLKQFKSFTFNKVDIADRESLTKSFQSFDPQKIVNLAAQPGVRYSIENPYHYMDSNLVGFLNIIELCRNNEVKSFIYASRSSVYGGNKKMPFSVDDRVHQPLALYGATKRANELIAHSYSHLYGLHTTGLRYFTVYGSWYRPDMAMFIFTQKIMAGKPIPVFNNGNMKRDFTYIDDVIKGTRSAIEKNYKCEIFNLGNSKSESLMDLIGIIETILGKKAQIEYLPMQLGDVKESLADIKKSTEKLGYKPITTINKGIPQFIKWYKEYYSVLI